MSKIIFHKVTLVVILVILSVLSLMIGVANFSFARFFQGDELLHQIFWQVRVPRLITLILSAFGMCISGLIMQQLAQNKFASPSTATTIEGAKLGLLVGMLVFSANFYGQMLSAFIFALISTTIFMLFIQKIKIKNTIFIPLIGLMVGGILDALTTFISYQTDQIQNINAWMQANLSTIIKGNYEPLYIIVPMVIIAFLYANQFTIAGMGESFTTNLGLNHTKIVNIGLWIVSIITATVVISVGGIPFLGLIIPNIISIYRGDNLKNSIIETALLGAIFLITCDIFGRLLIFPYEIPLSLTVGVFGCIIFLYLLFSKENGAAKKSVQKE